MPTSNRRRAPSGGPASATWLGLLAVLILGGGAVLAVLEKRERATPAADSQADTRPRPFADLPPEQPPARRAGGGGDPAQPFGSAAGLLSDPLWTQAVALAGEGETLYQQAVAAKTRGDVPELNLRGNEAKRKLDEALETTAELEEQLLASRGETDPLVREVLRVRNGWFDRVRWLHKSTSR